MVKKIRQTQEEEIVQILNPFFAEGELNVMIFFRKIIK